MYTVKMLDKSGTEIFSQPHKELTKAVSVLGYWIKQDSYQKIKISKVVIEYSF